MRIPRRWWSSGLYIWIDLYRQCQLYRQFVETAREVKRLRKVRDEARRWERLGWTYGDHKAMQQQAMAAYMQAKQSPYGSSDLANAAHTQNPYRRGLLNSADRSLHDYVSCLGNLIG